MVALYKHLLFHLDSSLLLNLYFKKGCSVCRVSLSFSCFGILFMKYIKSSEFCMSMSDNIKQRVLQKVFANQVSFSWKTGKLNSFVLPEWENQHRYRQYFYLLRVQAAWRTVLICCTMCSTEQPTEQPQIGDGGSIPVAINQFFSLLGSHVLVLFFSFANILYFTWLTSFDLILL